MSRASARDAAAAASSARYSAQQQIVEKANVDIRPSLEEFKKVEEKVQQTLIVPEDQKAKPTVMSNYS